MKEAITLEDAVGFAFVLGFAIITIGIGWEWWKERRKEQEDLTRGR